MSYEFKLNNDAGSSDYGLTHPTSSSTEESTAAQRAHVAQPLLTTTWLPPNDRELTIRAKLKTGWSTRCANTQQNSTQRGPGAPKNLAISDNEYLEIENVLLRAKMIENKEMNRVNKLHQRYTSLAKPHGNGESACLICNVNFSLLTGAARICNDCLKNCCSTCSVETTAATGRTNAIWLCNICAEYRDFWKKSGAWFSQKMPSAETDLNGNLSKSMSSLNHESPNIQHQQQLHYHTPQVHHRQHQVNATTPVQLTKLKTNNKLGSSYSSSSDNEQHGEEDSADVSATSVDESSIHANDTTYSNCFHQAVQDSPLTSSGNRKESHHPHHQQQQQQEVNDNHHHHHHQRVKEKPLKSNPNSQDNVRSDLAKNTKPSPDKDTPGSSSSFLKDMSSMQDAAHKFRSNGNHLNANQALTSTKLNNSMSEQSLFHPPGGSETNLPVASILGSLQFTVEYIPSCSQLKIFIQSAHSLASKDSNGLSDPYVKVHLLPGIAKATKLRTRTVYKNLNPAFEEWLHYDGVSNSDLETKTLRFTVLDEDKFGFDFIGEYRLPLKTIILNEVNKFNVSLEEKQELGDEADTTFRGKINFAIKYSKISNALFVKINRCTQLLPMDKGVSSDPFVEIAILPITKEAKHKMKTTVKWKTLDPEYLEEFKFANIDLKTLLTKTIEISVWDKDFGKNDFIGTIELGQQRTGEELKHFFTMIKNPEFYHEQWHTLHIKDSSDTTDALMKV